MAFTLAAVAVVAAAASAYTTYNQYKQQANEADYARQVAENNRTAARQQAEMEAQTKEGQVKRLLAQQRAALAGSGGDPNEASPLTLELDSAYQGYRDVATKLWEGEARATAFGNEANFAKWRSKTLSSQALPSAFISGISTGVGSYFKMGGTVPEMGGGGGGIGAPGSRVPENPLDGASEPGASIPRWRRSAGTP